MQKRKTISKEIASKARANYIEKVASAAAIKTIGKPNSTLNVTQLKVMIASLKQKGDPVVPILKKDLLVRLTEYEIRG